jgi:hypothetical protein
MKALLLVAFAFTGAALLGDAYRSIHDPRAQDRRRVPQDGSSDSLDANDTSRTEIIRDVAAGSGQPALICVLSGSSSGDIPEPWRRRAGAHLFVGSVA